MAPEVDIELPLVYLVVAVVSSSFRFLWQWFCMLSSIYCTFLKALYTTDFTDSRSFAPPSVVWILAGWIWQRILVSHHSQLSTLYQQTCCIEGPQVGGRLVFLRNHSNFKIWQTRGFNSQSQDRYSKFRHGIVLNENIPRNLEYPISSAIC